MKRIQSVKSTWLILHSELKAHIIPPLEGNFKGRKTCRHESNNLPTLK